MNWLVSKFAPKLAPEETISRLVSIYGDYKTALILCTSLNCRYTGLIAAAGKEGKVIYDPENWKGKIDCYFDSTVDAEITIGKTYIVERETS